MGNRRIAVSVTATAASKIAEPAPSAESRITWAGAAHTSTVDSANHQDENAKSCASAPMPMYVPASTGKKTEPSAERTPPKKAAPGWRNDAGAGMDAAKLSHRPGTCATALPRMQHLQNAKAGRKARPRVRSIEVKPWPTALSALSRVLPWVAATSAASALVARPEAFPVSA